MAQPATWPNPLDDPTAMALVGLAAVLGITTTYVTTVALIGAIVTLGWKREVAVGRSEFRARRRPS